MDEAERQRRKREAMAPVEEAGGGVSEGYEQSERLLIDHTSHGDQHAARKIIRDSESVDEELLSVQDRDRYGEADHERSSETGQDNA
jgi:hypothetical protein